MCGAQTRHLLYLAGDHSAVQYELYLLFCGAGRDQGSVLRHGKTLDRRSDGSGKDAFAAFRRGTDSAGRSAGDRGVCEAGGL